MPQISLQHDGPVDIATALSRKSVNWKNKEVQWSELVTKVSETHYTAETHSEYMAAKKPRQDEIKDIGGFVGGYLNQGRRKKEAVAHRQLITLDIDLADKDTWENFLLLYSEAACVYSTHKHTPENPRLRIVIPLDRPVAADEYIAIARRIAGDIDVEQFDDSCFRVHQLMYWPSTSKGSEFFFRYQDGPWLSADNVLSSYHDWKDSSEWPVSERYQNVIQQAIKKQGDPLEKPGIVGAWCRTYTIEEIIEKELSDVYTACDVEGRYTYVHGSTSGGLVIYEDKYAYSHHGTDPCSGKLCNAFDLVRLHKYGLKDEDAREGTPGNKLPSYTAMVDFASKDTAVRKLLVSEKLEEAHADFSEEWQDGEEPYDDSWQEQLDVDKKGNIQSTINNVSLILEHDPRLRGCFATDEFRKKKVVMKNLPWRKITPDTKYLKDQDEQNLVKFLEKNYDITTRSNIKDAFDTHIDHHSFHPVRDYLDSLKWDGVHRVDSLMIEYMGAEDNAYIKAATRKALVAAVARIYHPGIKFDYVPTLIGKEGIKKSTILRKLGREWFSDSFSFNMLHSKEAYEQLQGFWIIEIAELTGLRNAEVEAAKQFISKQEDSFRVAYGRNVVTFKRQCVFFGTTNNRDFLKSTTGNRRFWPVDTLVHIPAKNVDDLTDEEVGKIWSEAVHYYKKGEPLYLNSQVEAMAVEAQMEHSELDERTGIIQKYLDTLLPDMWDQMGFYDRRAWLAGQDTDELQPRGTVQRKRVCAGEIWCECLGGLQKDINRFNTKEIHDIMRNIKGWKEYKSRTTFKGFGNQKGYYKEGVFGAENDENTTSSKKRDTTTTTSKLHQN